MKLDKKKRKLIASLLTVTVWFTAWATLGYFTGLRGVGVGWPAFWAVGGMSLLIPTLIGLFSAFIDLTLKWVKGGADE